MGSWSKDIIRRVAIEGVLGERYWCLGVGRWFERGRRRDVGESRQVGGIMREVRAASVVRRGIRVG
jgi:hypothetical protein